MSDLLPISATPQERAMSLSTARVGTVPVPVGTLWSPQTCPAGMLPWLAWALSVDSWDVNWTEQQKRDAIAASVDVHRRKGTVGAVKKALEAIGYSVGIGQTGPYTFSLMVNANELGGVNAQSIAVLNRAVDIALKTKNARSYLGSARLFIQTVSTNYAASVEYDGLTTQVEPGEQPDAGDAPTNLTAPTVSGTALIGQTLSRTLGTWGGVVTGYATQWRRDGAAISGQYGASYVVTEDDIGKTLSVSVTASNDSGSTTAYSNGLLIPILGIIHRYEVGQSTNIGTVADTVGANPIFDTGSSNAFWKAAGTSHPSLASVEHIGGMGYQFGTGYPVALNPADVQGGVGLVMAVKSVPVHASSTRWILRGAASSNYTVNIAANNGTSGANKITVLMESNHWVRFVEPWVNDTDWKVIAIQFKHGDIRMWINGVELTVEASSYVGTPTTLFHFITGYTVSGGGGTFGDIVMVSKQQTNMWAHTKAVARQIKALWVD